MELDGEILKLISLKGKVAIVTGAVSGIGLATSKILAKAGADVALLDINEKRGIKIEKEIKNFGTKVKFYRCDVTNDLECKDVSEKIYNDFGKVDILVNNAGIIIRKNILELSEKEWDAVLDVNLKGIFLLSRHLLPYMIEKGEGSIINIGSGWGLKGGPKASAYCAAKGGVVNLTRAMAIDFGKQGIRVNCVCPGDIDTPLLREEAKQLGEDLEKFMKEAAERPLNRVGKPEDVAYAVLFLASNMSSWVTGSVIVVDGGGIA